MVDQSGLSAKFKKLKGLFSSKRSFFDLEDGEEDPVCLGTNYSQSILRQLYRQTKGEKIQLTLTPICSYQIQNKWPEPPFVNVNLPGSKATESYNWLGYIPLEDPTEIDFARLIEEHGNLNVRSSICKNGSEYYIKFFISKKYKPTNVKKTYISHTEDQIDLIKKIACESGKDYIVVSKKAKNKEYLFKYGNLILGTASCKKIDSVIGNKPVKSMSLSIKKFRFMEDRENSEYEDNYHYSTLFINLE